MVHHLIGQVFWYTAGLSSATDFVFFFYLSTTYPLDDSVLYRDIESSDDHDTLQQDLL